MAITELLTKNASLYPNEVSLVEREPALCSRRELTWLEFENQSNKIANALIDFGIKKGDKVALLLMNCLEWLPCYFGILKTGAMAVPLNFRFTSGEIEKCTAAADAKILFYGPEFCERITEVKDNLSFIEKFIFVDANSDKNEDICNSLKTDINFGNPDRYITYENLIDKYSSEALNIKITNEDDAALYFTSGTTGTPKPIMLTHANLLSAAVTEEAHHKLTHQDNYL
ncbi:MAG: class I adenylate-forming enzyme family protein [Candidatus Methanomethylophilus sp.]|nr:class I adenylate-forming enzyme family protein [Methanomethylophilus sp.]